MRRFFFIITAFSALLLSCVKQPEPVVEPQPLPFSFDGNLLRIDSLMQHDADSALVLLLDKACLVPTGCDDLSDSANACVGATGCDDLSRSGKACLAAADANDDYRSLLLSEALYKTGNAQLNRFRSVETCHGASLQEAVRCFDSLAAQYHGSDDIVVLSARAHYMNGVGFYENDSVVEACREYLKTLEIMENRFDEDELVGYKAKFMGLTYTRLGEVYFYNGIADASLYSRKKALACFKRLENYDLANTFRSVGGAYLLDHQNDSALFYYRKAIDLSKKSGNVSVYASSLSESAPIYYELGYIDSAFMMARKALMLPSTEDLRLSRCFTLGYLFEKESEYDSAICYLEKSIERVFYATQTASAELLMKCYHSLGDTMKMQRYKMIYGDHFDTYRKNSVAKNELTKIYDDYMQEQLQKANQLIEKQRKHRNIYVLCIVFAIIVSFFVVTKRIGKKKIEKHKTALEKTESSLSEIRMKIEMKRFTDEPICQTVLNVVKERQFRSKINYLDYKDCALGMEQIIMLRETANLHYDKFTIRLKKKFPELTNDDLDYCCLYLLGLKDADVSALMQKEFTTVCYHRRKIKSILKSERDLTETLYNLASI